MCTSLTFRSEDFYCARNMDIEYSFGEKIIITPRKYVLNFKKEKTLMDHYAMIGIGAGQSAYPLYAEAINEKGLYAAALKFKAFYPDISKSKFQIAPYELIPWILAKCKSVNEAKALLQSADIINIPFNREIGVSPLHYHIADRESSITVERGEDGLKIYKNDIGILTNDPPFDIHMKNLQDKNLNAPYILGTKNKSLPGDFSSESRFLKLAYLKNNTVTENGEASVKQTLFRLMAQCSVPKGSVITNDNKYHYTTYTAVINVTKGLYYYNTHKNIEIKGISLLKENLNSEKLIMKEI